MLGIRELEEFMDYCITEKKWTTSVFHNSLGEFHLHIRVAHKGVIKDAMGWDLDLRAAIKKTRQEIEEKLDAIEASEKKFKEETQVEDILDDLI